MKRTIKRNLSDSFWFVVLLQTIFIILKVTNTITWGWLTVLLPLIICVSVKVFLLMAFVGIGLYLALHD